MRGCRFKRTKHHIEAKNQSYLAKVTASERELLEKLTNATDDDLPPCSHHEEEAEESVGEEKKRMEMRNYEAEMVKT